AQPKLDLLPYLQSLSTDKKAVSVQLPPDASGQTTLLPLNARGNDLMHRWVIGTFANHASTAQDLVLEIPHQGFSGSGLVWPRPEGPRAVGLASTGAEPAAKLTSVGSDAFALRLDPGQAVTLALEVTT